MTYLGLLNSNKLVFKYAMCFDHEEHIKLPTVDVVIIILCHSPKDNGDLAIRDLYTVNRSLLLKSAWHIATEQNPYLTAVLKSKYFPSSSFWTADANHPKTVF
jgi:hypothetical protein